MGKLRDQMADEMLLKGYSERTIRGYISYVRDMARFWKKSPLKATGEDIRAYFLHLIKERRVSESTLNMAAHGLRVFLKQTGRTHLCRSIPEIKRPKNLPSVMSASEIDAFMNSLEDLRYRAIFVTIYCAGLRLGEVTRLQMSDVDTESLQIKVRCAKGKKDRYSILFPENREILKEYIARYEPKSYVFYTKGDPEKPVNPRVIQKIFGQTKVKAGVRVGASVHTLRHTFATQLLENGVNVFLIQRLMGHSSIKTTLQYFHMREYDYSNIPSPLVRCSIRRETLKDGDQLALEYPEASLLWK